MNKLRRNDYAKLIEQYGKRNGRQGYDYIIHLKFNENYRKSLENSKRIASPGCYSTGANVILKPLITNGILSKNIPIIINAVSGYSGGGKSPPE